MYTAPYNCSITRAESTKGRKLANQWVLLIHSTPLSRPEYCTCILHRASGNETGFFSLVGCPCNNNRIPRYLLPDTCTSSDVRTTPWCTSASTSTAQILASYRVPVKCLSFSGSESKITLSDRTS